MDRHEAEGPIKLNNALQAACVDGCRFLLWVESDAATISSFMKRQPNTLLGDRTTICIFYRVHRAGVVLVPGEAIGLV